MSVHNYKTFSKYHNESENNYITKFSSWFAEMFRWFGPSWRHEMLRSLFFLSSPSRCKPGLLAVHILPAWVLVCRGLVSVQSWLVVGLQQSLVSGMVCSVRGRLVFLAEFFRRTFLQNNL